MTLGSSKFEQPLKELLVSYRTSIKRAVHVTTGKEAAPEPRGGRGPPGTRADAAGAANDLPTAAAPEAAAEPGD